MEQWNNHNIVCIDQIPIIHQFYIWLPHYFKWVYYYLLFQWAGRVYYCLKLVMPKPPAVKDTVKKKVENSGFYQAQVTTMWAH